MELNASPGVVAEASALELDLSRLSLAKPVVLALVLSKVAGRATIRGMIWSCTWRRTDLDLIGDRGGALVLAAEPCIARHEALRRRFFKELRRSLSIA